MLLVWIAIRRVDRWAKPLKRSVTLGSITLDGSGKGRIPAVGLNWRLVLEDLTWVELEASAEGGNSLEVVMKANKGQRERRKPSGGWAGAVVRPPTGNQEQVLEGLPTE